MNIADLMGGDTKRKLRTLANVIAAEWVAEARGSLRRSADAYIKSVGVREVTDTRAVVSLPGPDAGKKAAQLARIVEFGMGPGGIGTEGAYDVRKFLLRAGTRNLKWGKSGPYVNVPFQRRGASSEVPGPLEIERLGGRRALLAARKLSPRVNDPATNQLLSRSVRLGAGWAQRLRAHHVSDPLEGLVREASTYSDKGGWQTSGFKVWRRASWANRDPAAWRSKGVKARHLARKVQAKVPDLIREVF